MTRVLFVILCLALPLSATAEDWYPSKWGASDTLGSINEVTPEVILNAAKLIKVGKRYALGQVTSRDTPAAGTRTHALFVFSDGADGLRASDAKTDHETSTLKGHGAMNVAP